MRSDKLEKAKQLVGASLEQADATSYAPATKHEPEPELGPVGPPATESEKQASLQPDSKPDNPTPLAYGFVVPAGTGHELVQLGVRIPADLRAALRTCSMMQQVEMQELIRDALERELRRRAIS